jgi:hypothetical protein
MMHHIVTHILIAFEHRLSSSEDLPYCNASRAVGMSIMLKQEIMPSLATSTANSRRPAIPPEY